MPVPRVVKRRTEQTTKQRKELCRNKMLIKAHNRVCQSADLGRGASVGWASPCWRPSRWRRLLRIILRRKCRAGPKACPPASVGISIMTSCRPTLTASPARSSTSWRPMTKCPRRRPIQPWLGPRLQARQNPDLAMNLLPCYDRMTVRWEMLLFASLGVAGLATVVLATSQVTEALASSSGSMVARAGWTNPPAVATTANLVQPAATNSNGSGSSAGRPAGGVRVRTRALPPGNRS